MRTKEACQAAFSTFDAVERDLYTYALEHFKHCHNLSQDAPSLEAASYAVGVVLARRSSQYRGMSGVAA